MNTFHQTLVQNKKAKGLQLDLVAQAIAGLEDPNLPYQVGSQTQSPLGFVIELAHNEEHATSMATLLIERGARASDAQVPGQPHDKAINVAINNGYYTLAFLLIENGANIEDVVHALLRRPKTSRQARGQLAMEQTLWQSFDHDARKEYCVPIMVSLLACEVITGQHTDPTIRNEVIKMAAPQTEEGLNHHYLLSNLDDACKVLKNPKTALARMSTSIVNWFDGLGLDTLNFSDPTFSYPHLPKEFWGHIPSLGAQAAADRIDQDTAQAPMKHKGLRL